MSSFKEFFFDGNLAWGRIQNETDWERVLYAYRNTGMNLLDVKCDVLNPFKFGLYTEYRGHLTLREFLSDNNMRLKGRYHECQHG